MSSQPVSDAPARRLPPHVAVNVSGGVIRAGSASRRFRPGDARSLLIAYLALIRGLRDQRRARTIELRSADIEALAGYLGRPGSEVVERLAEMMGASRAQRATMLTLFGTGALVIGLAGSTAGRAQSSPSTSRQPSVAVQAVAPQASPAVGLPAPVDVSTSSSAPATTTTTAAPTTTLAAAPLDAPAPPPPIPTEPPTINDPPSATAPPRPRSAPPAASAPVEEAPDPTEAPPESAPDDTVITDIGTPPIPPATDPAPDDTVITDIGTPPIPPGTDPPAG